MAARKVYFYNSRGGDRKYNADGMTDWLNPFFTTGVFNNCFRVTANDNMTVTITGGYANIKGKTVKYADSETFDLAVASGTLSRIDNVVLRRDDTARDIYLMVQTGGFSANPEPPPIVREDAIFDLKLAEVRVDKGTIKVTAANITDTRMRADVCGWVVATVKEIDFSGITDQFNTFFRAYTPKITAEYSAFETYISTKKAQSDDALLALQAYLETLKAQGDGNYEELQIWFDLFKTQSESDFDRWFSSLQDVLGENEVANLLNLISGLTARVERLEATLFNQITTNPFAVKLATLDGVAATGGVWNTTAKRIEC